MSKTEVDAHQRIAVAAQGVMMTSKKLAARVDESERLIKMLREDVDWLMQKLDELKALAHQ